MDLARTTLLAGAVLAVLSVAPGVQLAHGPQRSDSTAGMAVGSSATGDIDDAADDERTDDDAATAPAPAPEARFGTEAYGHSGALRAAFSLPGEPLDLPLEWDEPRPPAVRYEWAPVLGTEAERTRASVLDPDRPLIAAHEPGVYELRLESREGASRRLHGLRVVVQVPFEEKDGRYLDGYHIGRYPTEGSGRTDRYAPPTGFVRVSAENQHLRLSENFTLKEFLTHDQKNVWPKYAVVDARLLDKLELVMDDLTRRGIPARDMVVMSGFRTPQYNRQGLGAGRARLSRHQFGDGADVWIDNDGDWYMDDLNSDDRRDTRDARVMLAAVERIETRFPELLGGAGIYRDNGVHGPFIHIDVRGYRARW